MTDKAVPSSTYRLQLTSDFGFAAAADLAGYLADLGVSHVYLSPILQAVPGSRHGYEVIDHSRVSDDLGGEAAFRAMAEKFRDHGLGVVVDVVPNHMAVPAPESLNRQLWSVLEHGQDSPYAHWFDIDWTAHDGRMLLPVLANAPEQCAKDLVSDPVNNDAETGVLRYFEHVFPLPQRHYLLASWRAASTELNWRRFFDISTLIGIRQEDPDVFAATHRTLIRLHAAGFIDGFRIDHPDGLADPRGYFRRLTEATGGAWIVAEKILAHDEALPADWQCAGSTGYDALALVDRLFTDPAGQETLTRTYHQRTGSLAASFAEVAGKAKRELAERTFAAELTRLITLFPAGLAPERDLREVLTELLAGFEVYRAYVYPGEHPQAAALARIGQAAGQAWRRLPDRLHPVLDLVTSELVGEGDGDRSAELVVRFQQTTGPVIAKGTEDTAGYRCYRLVSLNEVGGDPDQFAVPAEEFHAKVTAQSATWPDTMTTLSTHDAKRQEDVRARLAVLTEPGHADQWAGQVAAWRAALPPNTPDIDPGTEYLIWQTLAGGWPISQDRLGEYLTKAVREAKVHTSWTDPDLDYEQAVRDFASKIPAKLIAAFADRIAADARVNTLGAKLVQLTMPGVPDLYQGCELTAYALTDPDNRRPVDFQHRQNLLASLPHHARDLDLDQEKLLVTSRALRLRRDHPTWFRGGYTPLAATGPAARHAVAFAREHAVTVATRLPAGLRTAGGWANTLLQLPSHSTRWRDVLTGELHRAPVELAELLRYLPVALLVPEQPDP